MNLSVIKYQLINYLYQKQISENEKSTEFLNILWARWIEDTTSRLEQNLTSS